MILLIIVLLLLFLGLLEHQPDGFILPYLLLLLLPLPVHVLLVTILLQTMGYFELVLRLLGEEVAQDVEIRSILPQQNVEQFHFLLRPDLGFLFALSGMVAGYGIGLRLVLGLLLREVRGTTNSMLSMREPRVRLGDYSADPLDSPSIYIR
jgi:phosphotransferase system  glucose/maltose/N-acetylglucosamine-specific IIC component